MDVNNINKEYFESLELEKNRKIQEKILELLKEVDLICRENNIEYFLADHLLLGAVKFKGFIPNSCSATILMDGENREKFVNYCINKGIKDDRYIECIENNYDFPGLAVNYGDKNSLFLHVEEFGFFKNNGIHIIIEVLKPFYNDKFNRTLSKLYDRGLEVRVFNVKGNISKHMNYANKTVNLITKTFGKKNGINMIKKHVLFQNKNYDKLCYSGIWEHRKYIDKSLKNSNTDIEFEGTKFKTFENYREFLRSRFGIHWAMKDITGRQPVYPIIVEPDISYSEYMRELANEGINEDDFLKKNSLLRKYNKKLKTLRKYVNKQWDIVCSDFSKVNMQKEYMPIKENLEEAFYNKNFEKLFEYLYDYIQNIYESLYKGLPLFFDIDILIMVSVIMIDNYRFLDIKKLMNKLDKKETDLSFLFNKNSYNRTNIDYNKYENINLCDYYYPKKNMLNDLYLNKHIDDLKKELLPYISQIYKIVDMYLSEESKDNEFKLKKDNILFDLDMLKYALIVLLYDKDIKDIYLLLKIYENKDFLPYLQDEKMNKYTFKWLGQLAEQEDNDVENEDTYVSEFTDN